jgi:uncharacterized membrane protein YfhO
MATAEFDPAGEVLLDREPALRPEPGDSAAVSLTRQTMDEVAFTADLGNAGILVVSEVFYPDWRVTVNGQPAEIMRANHVIRAIALPAGKHEVVFTYDRGLLKKSAGISVGAFALTLLVLLGTAVTRWKGAPWKRSS